MGRAGILALVLVMAFGLAATTAQAKAKKVESEVEFEAWYYPPPDFQFTLVGDIHSKKNKCEKGRTVTIIAFQNETDDGTSVGPVTTDATGDFEYDPSKSPIAPYHAAEVERKKITKPNGNKLVCKADSSPRFYVD